ncbi:MAG: MATE family multidrug resistance protein [Candidatus Omnitrophota bacterium]|jgi:MATE family multidrug resistance protein
MDWLKRKHREGGMWEMLVIAFPMLVANACDTVIIFTDRLFVAKLGSIQMNASFIGGLSVYLLMTFFVGLTGYATALIAQHLGAGQKDACARVLTQAVIIAVLAFPITLACRPLVYYLFEAMHINPAQIALQKQYFNILSYIIFFGLIKNCFNSYFAGIGKTGVIMVAACVSMSFNVFLNYILIYGKFGCPAYGMVGAAYGSIIASFFGFLVLIWVYLGDKNQKEFGIKAAYIFDWPLMRKLLHLGYPAGLELFLNMLSFTMLVMLFHSVSPVAATAASIVFNWDIVAYVPLLGVEIGVTSLVGRYMGAGKPEIAHQSMLSGIRFGICFSAILFILFLFAPAMLVNVFSPLEPTKAFLNSASIAENMLRMSSIYVLTEVIMLAMVGALRGAGDTFWAMVLTVSLHWVLVPLLYIILHVLHLAPEVAWLTLIATFFVFLGFVVRRYNQGAWKQIKLVN